MHCSQHTGPAYSSTAVDHHGLVRLAGAKSPHHFHQGFGRGTAKVGPLIEVVVRDGPLVVRVGIRAQQKFGGDITLTRPKKN